MKQLHEELHLLISRIPTYNSPRGIVELSNILSRYKQTLGYIGRNSNNYKLDTFLYYSEVSDIEMDLRRAQSSDSKISRDAYFWNTKNKLQIDLEALADEISEIIK